MAEIDLLTVEDRVRLLVNALADERDHLFPVVKLFTPDAGATWLLTECDPDEPNSLFGLCDLGLGHPELGWVSLAEIKEVRGRLGLPVERDLHFTADKPISAYAAEARAKGRIIA
ncbi:DUF2958 domain-containing protein [Bradyrhizobium japonicum]|uniref:DUF2958 domain-containing protein n=1 Tax=Bradyrhizobium japonicum TaxID=375 RepID=UPI001E4B9721|nr:DUF2958 domain-containing protein [Bradyrhizobium japonicum]MCD9892103.1 DUF2958 domain-containing protein [Bradyrhizobium japonicum]WRJ83867.1 DUF2958 domain-containing protein [Bradyrhizobium japonicum]WRJ92847.1 DUF2958 domain-containing protein [Bradyrhizobium japonicum]WRK46689.1 DUF2958 domain-containing protein [Bradyrhizobium japonicum]